jgi:hypothetical protein
MTRCFVCHPRDQPRRRPTGLLREDPRPEHQDRSSRACLTGVRDARRILVELIEKSPVAEIAAWLQSFRIGLASPSWQVEQISRR